MKTFKTKLLAIVTLLCSIAASAHDIKGVVSLNLEQNDEEISEVTDLMPEFPGGTTELMKWLSNNVKYPTISFDAGIQGTVITRFVVDKDGSIVDPFVLYGVDPYLEKEAIRVVKAMPKWKPGEQGGEPVRVAFTLPIQFKLSLPGSIFEIEGNTYEIRWNNKSTVELTKGTNTESVSIPESVTYNGKTYAVTGIRNDAFRNCVNLTSLIIPKSIISIGESAFCSCSSLTSINVDKANTVFNSRDNCNAIIQTKSNTLVLGCKTTVIPNNVTSIGTNAFYGRDVTSVKIPESVTNIGRYAFGGFNRSAFTIPNSVTSIGIGAFVTSGLTSITIPENVTSIGEYAFGGCFDLKTITFNCKEIGYRIGSSLPSVTKEVLFGNSVKSIGHEAFRYCSNLTSVNIPDNVTKLDTRAFADCMNLASVNIAEGVKEIGYAAFYNCPNLTSVTIPNSATNVGEWAFGACSSLTSVSLPNALSKICTATFYECTGLTSVEIPNSVKEIGEWAFGACSSLTSVSLPNALSKICTATFYECTGLTSVEIPNSVKEIGGWAFDNCSSLTSVEIPNSVEKMDTSAFRLCTALTSVKLSENLKKVSPWNFAYCSKLQTIEIPNSVTEIGTSAFGLCSELTNVSIGNSVTTIGDYAFEVCNNLANINLGNAITNIGQGAFDGCHSLTSITIPKSVTKIGSFPFAYCSSLANLTVEEGNTVYDSRNNCNALIETATNKLISGCKNTVIPNTVTSIGIYAFGNCSGLTELNLPNSITNIEERAFNDCYNLKNISLPNSVKTIGNYAFSNCTELTDITIPNSITNIEEGLFKGCFNLSKMNIPNSVTEIEDYAFYGCWNLTDVTVSNSLTSIGDSVFYQTPWFENLPDGIIYLGKVLYDYIGEMPADTSIDVMDGITTINNDAFKDYTGLVSITVPSSLEKIEDNAFEGCVNLKTVINLSKLGFTKGYPFDGYIAYYATNLMNVDGKVGDFLFTENKEVNKLSYYLGNKSDLTLPMDYKGGNYEIANNVFYRNEKLEKVSIPNAVTKIEMSAFEGCINLTEVYIGSGMKEIVDMAFFECYNLKTITVAATTPPTLSEYEFDETAYQTIIVRVPQGSLAAYKADDVWKNFWNIEEYDATGIGKTLTDTSAAAAPIYNLQGTLMKDVENLPSGIYIQGGKKFRVK